jgi:ribonuclease III
MKADGGADLDALERRTGYHFHDRTPLLTALTHASAVGDARIPTGDTYQRLEFLGDRVLGLVVAEMLLEAFPAATEGELSSRFADLVRKETCAEVAAALDLGAAVLFGGNRTQQRALQTVNVLGDVCEALIAAIYLDGGFEVARTFVCGQWRERMLSAPAIGRNAKTVLQEWAQAAGHGTPTYEIAERTGPDHAPTFAVSVHIGALPPGRGEGRNRREAEQEAAGAVLRREGVWQES